MRIAFYTPGWKQPEQDLMAALKAGCRGCEVVGHRNVDIIPGYDLACVVGVKAKALFENLRATGLPVLYWDKAYNRDWPNWWRVSVNAHQPVNWMMRPTSGDRAQVQGWKLRDWREWTPNGHVLITGSSLKYNNFHNLEHPTELARKIVAQLREHTDREIVYRPKPSWGAAEPIEGTRFSWSPDKSNPSIWKDLEGAHAIVTHGSNACFEALLSGVPSIVLGDAVVRPISSTDLRDVESPVLAGPEARQTIVNNLAYWQWSLAEIRGGQAWSFLHAQLQEVLQGHAPGEPEGL